MTDARADLFASGKDSRAIRSCVRDMDRFLSLEHVLPIIVSHSFECTPVRCNLIIGYVVNQIQYFVLNSECSFLSINFFGRLVFLFLL
jgi:hypothetical protein